MAVYQISVNGTRRRVETDDPEKPLLYVLRNDLRLTGPKCGCELGQGGVCTAVDRWSRGRSCGAPAANCRGTSVTTIEGLGFSAKPIRFKLPLSTSPPLGGGEASATPVPAALSNAVFDA